VQEKRKGGSASAFKRGGSDIVGVSGKSMGWKHKGRTNAHLPSDLQKLRVSVTLTGNGKCDRNDSGRTVAGAVVADARKKTFSFDRGAHPKSFLKFLFLRPPADSCP
jgi:hypothetical protein